MNGTILDKNGIPIEEFDVLKVFHFIGARKKKYYMYKLAVMCNGKLYGAHLNSNQLKPDYPLWTESVNPSDYEIVQSKKWWKLK
jgi:hypothetical protein